MEISESFKLKAVGLSIGLITATVLVKPIEFIFQAPGFGSLVAVGAGVVAGVITYNMSAPSVAAVFHPHAELYDLVPLRALGAVKTALEAGLIGDKEWRQKSIDVDNLSARFTCSYSVKSPYGDQKPPVDHKLTLDVKCEEVGELVSVHLDYDQPTADPMQRREPVQLIKLTTSYIDQRLRAAADLEGV